MQAILDVEDRVNKASEGFSLSIENVLQVGFNLIRKAPAVFIVYSVVGIVALSNPLSGLLLGGPVITGYYIAAHSLKKDQRVELQDFFRSFDKFVPLLLLNLLMSLVITLGLILLVVPGVYFAVSYIFSHFFVWFYDVEPTEAIRLSRRMVSGNFGQVFLLCMVLAAVNMIGVIAFGIGVLLTLPFSSCVLYAAFDDIIGIP